ncbi:MAG: hypothetical protein ACREXY_03350 [Gammaproteobacteria bacterium]
MKELFAQIAHLLTTLIKLARPTGGVRAVAAESMALTHQLRLIDDRIPCWHNDVFADCGSEYHRGATVRYFRTPGSVPGRSGNRPLYSGVETEPSFA